MKKPVTPPSSYWEDGRDKAEVMADMTIRAMIPKCEDNKRLTVQFVRSVFGLCDEPRPVRHPPIDEQAELRISLLIHGEAASKTQLVAAVYDCPLGSELWKMGVRALCAHILEEHGVAVA